LSKSREPSGLAGGLVETRKESENGLTGLHENEEKEA
jgi:hypothetical protein